MLVKNLLEVIPSNTVLHISNQRDSNVVTKTVGNFLLSDKDVYNRKVVLLTPNTTAIDILTE